MLSTYVPRPMSSGWSSLRLTGAPTKRAVVSVAVISGPPGDGRNGLDDVVVAGAAAEVALEAVPDRVRSARLAAVEERDGGEHHPRRAIAALQRVVVVERLLDRVQDAVGGEPFDRRELGPVRLDSEHGAGLHGLAVEQHRAGAARRGVTADVRAGQPEALAEHVDEQLARLELQFVAGAVD